MSDNRAVAEARRQFVAEPDASLRITGVQVTPPVGPRPGAVVCQVEIRRGVDVATVVTVNGSELLRMVNDVAGLLAWKQATPDPGPPEWEK